MRRTQRGNNNAYCQDNGVSWLDWSVLLDQHRDLHQFVRKLIAHRLRLLSAGHEESFGLSFNQLLRRAEIDWHGVRLGRPDWSDSSHSLALTVRPCQRQIPLTSAPEEVEPGLRQSHEEYHPQRSQHYHEIDDDHFLKPRPCYAAERRRRRRWALRCVATHDAKIGDARLQRALRETAPCDFQVTVARLLVGPAWANLTDRQ